MSTIPQDFDPEFPLKQQIVSIAGICMAFISITGSPLSMSLTVPTYVALSSEFSAYDFRKMY
ncbi:hypothetical protein G9A89_021114 [Geosiphon pyriformis]|nr:hypothetical protein G9A89_021114 [Geosiphon pyriformis]